MKRLLFTLLFIASFQASAWQWRADNFTGFITVNGSVGVSGSGVSAIDIYQLDCSSNTNDTDRATVAVSDNAPIKIPIITTYIKKGTYFSPLVSDIVDGLENCGAINCNKSSIETSLIKGKGIYYVYVMKNAYTGTVAAHKGVENYTIYMNCNYYYGTYATLIQNQ